MARILYSLAGEGRGHATRVHTIVEALRLDHEIILLAPDEAYDFLSSLYPCGSPNVFVRRISGLRFQYTRGRLDLFKSLTHGAGYWWQLPYLVQELRGLIDDFNPALAITDFEPALAQAAVQCGVPLVSLDHQHFLTSYDLSSLPLLLRGYAQLMALLMQTLSICPSSTIVSSFFRPSVRSESSRIVQVGPLIRPEISQLRPQRGNHLVSYVRKTTPNNVLEMLASCGLDVHVYGLGERKADGNLRFREIDAQRFAYDLADCAAVVGAAGNQTIGEALHLGKPVFALPENSLYEQMINAHYLKQMGAGDWITAEAGDARNLRHFLARLDQFEAETSQLRGRLDGAPAALAEIGRFIPLPAQLPPNCQLASAT